MNNISMGVLIDISLLQTIVHMFFISGDVKSKLLLQSPGSKDYRAH